MRRSDGPPTQQTPKTTSGNTTRRRGRAIVPTGDYDLTWATASNFEQLCELTARWLEGVLDHNPSYGGGPPDPETGPLAPVLAAVNRAGFLTDFSQPGIPGGDDGRQQRAAVCGFCSGETTDRLSDALGPTDLVLLAEINDSGVRIPVTLDKGEGCTWVGGAPAMSYVADCYPGVPRESIAALASCWYVTILDPVWGRDDRLWPTLLAAMTS